MTRHVSNVLLLLLLGACPVVANVDPAVLQAEADRVAVIEQAKQSVLAIFTADGEGGGSGVVISPDGFALTNFHVAQPCGAAMKCGMADGRVYDAVIVGMDPVGDVALIRLFGRDDFPAAGLADSDEVRVGDWAYVMGNPFLLASDFQPTVTYGIISGVHRYQYPAGTLLEYADCIQTDASINPGNSGGPLFDAQGRLIGINGRGSFEKRGRVNVGVGWAISINQIKNFLGYLHSGRIVDHATLGATVAFDEEQRVVVSDILEGSDAYRRGLRYDDEVVSFGGRPVDTPNGFKNVLGIYPKGWSVPLSYRRGEERFDVRVRLAGVHGSGQLIEKMEGRQIESPLPRPGQEKPERPPGGDVSEAKAEPKLPEIVANHYEERRGYANYYYNRRHRDRVWRAWQSLGDLSGSGGWTIGGPLDGGGEFRFDVTDVDATLDVPAGNFHWTASGDLTQSLTPAGSGGLLAAVYLWRRLATQGPDGFGEVYYLGTAPVAGRVELVDVLVGGYGGLECRFYFDPVTGCMVGLSMFASDDADPCEIRFTRHEEFEGRILPRGMEVRHGEEMFAEFRIQQFQTTPLAP